VSCKTVNSKYTCIHFLLLICLLSLYFRLIQRT
jgi:hypothetical protein